MEDTKKDTTLILLKILMQKSSRNNPLRKDEILDIFADEYDMFIEPKQFYRCYEKLIQADYAVVKVKGKSACYYYDDYNIRESDALYLSNEISKLNLSVSDRDRLNYSISYNSCLEEDNKSLRGMIDEDDKLFRKIEFKENDINYSILDDFNLIYNAFKRGRAIEYKTYINNEISSKLVSKVNAIEINAGVIKVRLDSGLYEPQNLINVKILKN